MKELQLYLVKCIKTNPTRTLAYKIGIAQDYLKRDIRNEFLGLKNADPNQSKIDIEVEPNLILNGPDFFIRDLETSILNDYFKDDSRYFATKKEYIESYEETALKYQQLLKILEKEEDNIKYHTSLIRSIDENKQTLLLNHHKEDIKKLCGKIVSPIKIIVPPTANQITLAKIPQTSIDKIKIKDILLKDFKLYKKGTKYYLQHQEYHKGKIPTEYRGAFSVTNNNDAKFQFHGTSDFLDKYKYDATCVSLKYVLKSFNQNIIDLDVANVISIAA
jgi:hypothetical protein